jgi:hypothetical protein
MKTDERKGSHQTMSLFGDEPRVKPQPVTTTGMVEIFFDGGCLGNPGQKYGSFQVLFDGKQVVGRNRVEFGHGTNNEAEFNSLKLALDKPSLHKPESHPCLRRQPPATRRFPAGAAFCKDSILHHPPA